MATDELITDIVDRLDVDKCEEIARRIPVYDAKIRRDLLIGVIGFSALVFVAMAVLCALLVVLDINGVDDMAGDATHIWGLITCVYIGIWLGGKMFKKSLLEHISERGF